MMRDHFDEDSFDWTALRDGVLLQRFKKGNNEALREILRRYEEPLIGFLTGYLCDSNLAQDVAQETFLRLIKRPPRRLNPDSLKPWLFRVAKNQAIDAIRKRKRMSPLESQPEPATIQKTEMARSDAEYLMSQLPENLRAVVTLRIYAELTFEEIAKQLSIPLGTALWRMRRSLELMREELERNES
ncbi:RNA polymerase sigma factor [Rubellicoccus peritrichatus]|uniref:RNA polymerase sigma factor n=1 Tax=Rubellicoccus peritrichatus TaxID=3080537 RepID=A0AAQ3LB97_9BACT|nr:RNA polymerase sigma factor [Puniceicoccus sp. CR14]WOO41122.1 RNA polymerase sigma factor [Puniceicoccus sp. CR14]